MKCLALTRVLPFLACTFALAAAADPAPPGTDAEVRVEHPENYCLGGIEDRKIIVDESRLTDPFRQTTRLGCQVDGGDPQTMPDLPSPTAEHRVLG
jgi:hypothetical protein